MKSPPRGQAFNYAGGIATVGIDSRFKKLGRTGAHKLPAYRRSSARLALVVEPRFLGFEFNTPHEQ